MQLRDLSDVLAAAGPFVPVHVGAETAVSPHAAAEALRLLADYAQERGQAKRACDGLPDVVEALREGADVQLGPHQSEQAPQSGLGALLRYADSDV